MLKAICTYRVDFCCTMVDVVSYCQLQTACRTLNSGAVSCAAFELHMLLHLELELCPYLTLNSKAYI